MAVYFAPISNGLGDLIICLPAIQWLIASGEPTYLVLRSPRQEGCQTLIPGLAGSVREVDLDPSKLQPGDRYINMRQHPLQTDHVWGSAEFQAKYPDYKITDIVRKISHDFGIAADFDSLTPLPFTQRSDVSESVLFIAGSCGLYKLWQTESWIELNQRLKACGLPVQLVGQPDKSPQVGELVRAGLPLVATPTLRDALDVVSSARAVVSVDTGLMHLALQQLVPSVSMWIDHPGPLNFLRKPPHCFPIISPPCISECVNEDMNTPFNLVTQYRWEGYDSWVCHAAAEMRCMNRVSVSQVFEQLTKALSMAALS